MTDPDPAEGPRGQVVEGQVRWSSGDVGAGRGGGQRKEDGFGVAWRGEEGRAELSRGPIQGRTAVAHARWRSWALAVASRALPWWGSSKHNNHTGHGHHETTVKPSSPITHHERQCNPLSGPPNRPPPPILFKGATVMSASGEHPQQQLRSSAAVGEKPLRRGNWGSSKVGGGKRKMVAQKKKQTAAQNWLASRPWLSSSDLSHCRKDDQGPPMAVVHEGNMAPVVHDGNASSRRRKGLARLSENATVQTAAAAQHQGASRAAARISPDLLVCDGERAYESSQAAKKQATAQTLLTSRPRLSSSDQQGMASRRGSQSSRANRQASEHQGPSRAAARISPDLLVCDGERAYESSQAAKKQATAQTLLASRPRLSSSDQQGMASKRGSQSSRANRQASEHQGPSRAADQDSSQ
ncbi:hypothetical protein THAOC_04814, partial [Thalassiosira oceanica]